MSVEQPTTSNASINSLPDPKIVDRSGPIPVVHGAAAQAVFNGIHRGRTIYAQVFDRWRGVVGSNECEPGVVAELESDEYGWLESPPNNRDWVIKITSSRWKGGTGVGSDYSAWCKYDLTLRQRDEDGQFHKTGQACSLRVIPQFDRLNYEDGGEITYQYGEGTLVRCSTTWAETGEKVESRMFDILTAVVDDVDQQRLLEDRNYQSRRIQKAEVLHRFQIGLKRQVIDAIDRTRELIAFGGMSEIDASHTRQRAGYLEAVINADRWHLLGFERTPFDIELKCYQTNGWDEYPKEDPAHHPKIEASFAGVSGDGELPHVDEWEDVLGVLRTIVSAHLDWSGVNRGELVADDYQPGSGVPEYQYSHPTGRREQLRERFETVGTEVYREALKPNTQAVYDILLTIATESGATYDLLEERVGLARSTIRNHVARLDEIGVVERLGNPVLVVFTSLAVLEDSEEILREVYPEDQVEDMLERAEERRQRREERQECDQGADNSSSSGEEPSERKQSEWRYFGELGEIGADQMATALDHEWLPHDHVRVRVDAHDWIG